MRLTAQLFVVLALATPAAWARGDAATHGWTVGTSTWRDHASWQVFDIAVDPERAPPSIAIKRGGDMIAELAPPDAAIAINGGYFLANYRPAGWLVDGAGVYSPPNTSNHRGGVLLLSKAGIYIGPLAGAPPSPTFVVQNSPLLVEAGGKNGINRDDGRRAARTVACLMPPGTPSPRLHFIVVKAPPGDGPTLKEAAEELRLAKKDGGFGCDAALNFDGGPSTGIWFRDSKVGVSAPPLVKIGYAVVFK